jgi:hypothetical protein
MAIILQITLPLLLALLAGCATGPPDPPRVANTRAEAECKVMYDQAFIAARGYADGQTAKQLYWDCLKAKGQ